MPSSPRKRVNGNEEAVAKATKNTQSDNDDNSDELPDLIPCSDDEETDEADFLKNSASKAKGKAKGADRQKTNGECAEKWYKLSRDDKEKNIHVTKIYLLSPFLFGQVYQDDKWINWAYECGLLPSKSSFEIGVLKEEHLDAVDLIESAFNKLVENLLYKNKDGLAKALEIITRVGMSQHLDKAITCAERFLPFTSVRDRLKLKSGLKKKQGDMALLFAYNQVSDHVKQLAAGQNLLDDFTRKCKEQEDRIANMKREGNEAFSNGKYTAAISIYSEALNISPYNHVLYGNRAQSYLKTGNFRCALADGRRATTLKAEWHKAQYRYAQAYFELKFYTRAKEVNRAGRKICSEKKILDTQYEKFVKSTQTTGKVKMAENNKAAQRNSSAQMCPVESDPEDLPDLVDANSSDTSRSDDESDAGNDRMPELVDLESTEESDDCYNSGSEGVQGLCSDSSDETDSDDSGSRRTLSTALNKTKNKSRKHEQEKARKEEMQKKQAELAAKIKEQKKAEKMTKDNKATAKELSVEAQRKRELNDSLKQGTKAIQEKKSATAAHRYGEALKIVERFTYQYFEMMEIDFVILLYSRGTACLQTGSYEELQEAMKQFEIIIFQHSHVDFPLAYLGKGNVFYKQNRFTEALQPLESGLTLVNKLGNKLCPYRWPASQIIIEESIPGRLLSAIETLIRICRHPPRPDAVCRYSECLGKTQIYLTDLDYKGYIRLICHESCKIDFHPPCWKKFKSNEDGKAGNKDFLDDECMTPDCSGSITNIQIYDAEGLKTEFKLEKETSKLEAKSKPAKQTKVKLSVGVSVKQKKKKERDEAKADQPGVPAMLTTTENSEEKQQAATQSQSKNAPSSAVQREEKPSEGEGTYTERQRFESLRKDTGLPPTDDGVYILRKECDEEPPKGAVKAKSKKKKLKKTQTLDQFLKDLGGQPPPLRSTMDNIDTDEIPPPRWKVDLATPPPGWSQHEMEAPFAVPPHLQDQAADFEVRYRAVNTSFASSSEQSEVENVTEYVSTLLQEILRENGPLNLADPKIMQPLSILPDHYQQIISKAGGLRPILEQSGKFVFDGNKVMLPKMGKTFQDIRQTEQKETEEKETKNPSLNRSETDVLTDPGLVQQTGVSERGIHDKSIWDMDGEHEGSEMDTGSSFSTYLSSSLSSLFPQPSTSPLFNPNAQEFVPQMQLLQQADLRSNAALSALVNSVEENSPSDVESVDDEIVVEESRELPNYSEKKRDHSLDDTGNHVVQPQDSCINEANVDVTGVEGQNLEGNKTADLSSALKINGDNEPTVTKDNEPTVTKDNEPTVTKDSEPAVTKGSEPAATEDSEPTAVEDSEPAATANRQPTVTKYSEPTVTKYSEPAVSKDSLIVTGDGEPTVTKDSEPTVSKDSEPAATEDSELTVTKDSELTVTKDSEPTVTKDNEPTVTKDSEPAVTKDSQPAVTKDSEPTVTKDSLIVTEDGEPTVTKDNEPTVSKDNERTVIEDSEPTVTEDSEPTVARDSERSVSNHIKHEDIRDDSGTLLDSALGEADDKGSEESSSDHGELTSYVVCEQSDASSTMKEDLTRAQKTAKSNGSVACEPAISNKTKAVQTQPNVKTKGVGTDPIPEPYKAAYHRALAEKESLQKRLQEATDRNTALLNKNAAECDKLKKKLTEALLDKEKHLKEVQVVKSKNLEEMRKLKQQCEDKDSKIKTLTQKLQESEERCSTLSNLKKEVMSCKAQFSTEKESWLKDKSGKDELIKNVRLHCQHQQTRAQEAEVKLLELRRDVGLRFLERAYQESHITINNLMQALNARIGNPKVEELINTWKSYAAECHQRVVQCKSSFNDQIELLKSGRTLTDIPQLPIPGPPQYPAIPVLQSLVPGQQQQQQQQQQKPQPQSSAESNTASRASSAAPRPTPTAAVPAPPPNVASTVTAPTTGVTSGAAWVGLPVNGEGLLGAGPGASAGADKGRPSNSFERIMLRLSTMYSSFSRLELTGFIKEVRQNKHGSLTGLSLEDIVTSVSELVEQKRKAGLLRPGPAASATPSTRTNANTTQRPFVPTLVSQYKQGSAPPQSQQAQSAKTGVSETKMGFGTYEEDPCVICHEDMSTATDIVTLECTHRYHSPCIRKWLLGEQSTCPTCRVHALLPDEFPRLK